MTKSNFKKSLMTSFQWRYCYYITKLTLQNVSMLGPSQSKFLVTPVVQSILMLATQQKNFQRNRIQLKRW